MAVAIFLMAMLLAAHYWELWHARLVRGARTRALNIEEPGVERETTYFAPTYDEAAKEAHLGRPVYATDFASPVYAVDFARPSYAVDYASPTYSPLTARPAHAAEYANPTHA